MLEILAQVLVFFLGIAVWWKARKATRAGNTTWRRRVGLLFFLAPFLVIVGRAARAVFGAGGGHEGRLDRVDAGR